MATPRKRFSLNIIWYRKNSAMVCFIILNCELRYQTEIENIWYQPEKPNFPETYNLFLHHILRFCYFLSSFFLVK